MIISADMKAGQLEHRCPACGTVSSIDTAGLVLGVAFEGLVNPDLIRLPPCSCGRALSFLVRTWDETPPEAQGTPHDLQRRVVNALADQLKAGGRSHPDLKSIHDAEKATPVDLAAVEASVVVRADLKVAPAPVERVPNDHHPADTAPAAPAETARTP